MTLPYLFNFIPVIPSAYSHGLLHKLGRHEQVRNFIFYKFITKYSSYEYWQIGFISILKL